MGGCTTHFRGICCANWPSADLRPQWRHFAENVADDVSQPSSASAQGLAKDARPGPHGCAPRGERGRGSANAVPLPHPGARRRDPADRPPAAATGGRGRPGVARSTRPRAGCEKSAPDGPSPSPGRGGPRGGPGTFGKKRTARRREEQGEGLEPSIYRSAVCRVTAPPPLLKDAACAARRGNHQDAI